MRKTVKTIIAAGIILAGAAGAYAQTTTAPNTTPTPSKSSQTFGDWVVNCAQVTPEGQATKRICDVSQSLSQNETGKRVLTFQVLQEDAGFAAQILTPFGLDLAKGIEIMADDKLLLQKGFRTCLPQGCLVQAPLTEDLEKKLSTAEAVSVTMFDLSGNRLDIAISPNGLTDAMSQMRQ